MIAGRIREFLLYSAVAACALAFDAGLLTALVEFGNVHYLVAATASFAMGTLVSYSLCVRFVFRYRRLDTMAPELGIFAAVGAVGLVINAAMMFVGVELLSFHFLAAKVGSAGVTFLTNFVSRKVLLFHPFRCQIDRPAQVSENR